MSSLYGLSGLQDIDFKKHPDFSKRFFLSGEDKKAIRSFFTNDLIFFFESHPLYYIESKGDSILIRGKKKGLLAYKKLSTSGFFWRIY